METADEPGSAAAAPLEAQEKPAALAPAEPKKPHKRGRRADPLRAPPGYMKRLVEELGAEALARQEAREAARADPTYVPPQPRRPRRQATEAQAFSEMLMTPSQKRRRRTEELRLQREKKAAEGAAFLEFIQDRKAARAAAEKRVAERKAQGVKLSFEEWREEMARS